MTTIREVKLLALDKDRFPDTPDVRTLLKAVREISDDETERDTLRHQLADVKSSLALYKSDELGMLRQQLDESKAKQDEITALFMAGEHDCTVCGRVTANGTCTECRHGRSPLLLARATSKKLAEALKSFLRAAVEVVQRQPNYPDTNVGMRQEWVRTQIVEKLSALSKARIEAPPCATCGGSGLIEREVTGLASYRGECPACARGTP